MENPSSTKPKVITVRKANYIVLLLPVGLLLLTIGALVSMAQPVLNDVREIHETTSKANSTNLLEVVLYGLLDGYLLVVVAQNAYRDKRLSVENISGISWVTSFFLREVGKFLQLSSGHWSDFLSTILLGIPAILVIVTLLQGKSFAGFTMYQDKRIIKR